MERPEAQDAGTIILTGFEPERVVESVRTVIAEAKLGRQVQIAPDYQVPDTSWRVLKLILGNTGLSNMWWGIRQ